MSIENLRKWSGKDCCDFPQPRKKEFDIEIPAFMTPENSYRRQAREWREHNEQARIGAAVGAVKKENRQTKRAEHRKKVSNIEFILFASLAIALLIFVGAVELGLII